MKGYYPIKIEITHVGISRGLGGERDYYGKITANDGKEYYFEDTLCSNDDDVYDLDFEGLLSRLDDDNDYLNKIIATTSSVVRNF
jgi:hypothetical protein